MDAQRNQQLNDFAQDVVLLGLELVQQYFERQGDSVWLVTGQSLADEVLARLLAERPRSAEPRWLIASLRVQRNALPGSRLRADGNKFYLAVEVEVHADAPIRAVPSIFCPYRNDFGFRHFTDGAAGDTNEAVTILQPMHLLKHFLSRVEAFEAKAFALNAVISEAPKPKAENVPIAIAEGEADSGSVTALEDLAIAVFKPVPFLIKESPFEQARAAMLKVQVAQREEIGAFLTFLRLKETALKQLWVTDLARGSALAQQVMGNRPDKESEYQRAYDGLVQQATEFARSLAPNTLSEFADYFELYWTIAEEGCVSDQGDGTDAKAFIAQVQALGTSDDVGRVKVEILRQMQSVFSKLAVGFGQPNEHGTPERIGSGNISLYGGSTEQMIEAIQGQSEQLRVKFERLSWGVLQTGKAAGLLPRSERCLGRTVVGRFLRSARLTIEKPTQKVQCDARDAEYFEFRFERQILENQVSLRAIALVRVCRTYGRVVLYAYRFEER